MTRSYNSKFHRDFENGDYTLDERTPLGVGWRLHFELQKAVNQHINSPIVQVISITYRGAPVTHFLDPKTGINVIADQAGANYISVWQLGGRAASKCAYDGASVLIMGRHD